MKKSIIYIALAALAAAACTRTVETETPVEGRLKTISISASGEQISKARLDFPRINWEESDKVAIFDGVAKREFSVTSCDGTSARLSGDVAESAANLVAVSPLSAGISYEKGVLSVTLPSTALSRVVSPRGRWSAINIRTSPSSLSPTTG